MSMHMAKRGAILRSLSKESPEKLLAACALHVHSSIEDRTALLQQVTRRLTKMPAELLLSVPDAAIGLRAGPEVTYLFEAFGLRLKVLEADQHAQRKPTAQHYLAALRLCVSASAHVPHRSLVAHTLEKLEELCPTMSTALVVQALSILVQAPSIGSHETRSTFVKRFSDASLHIEGSRIEEDDFVSAVECMTKMDPTLSEFWVPGVVMYVASQNVSITSLLRIIIAVVPFTSEELRACATAKLLQRLGELPDNLTSAMILSAMQALSSSSADAIIALSKLLFHHIGSLTPEDIAKTLVLMQSVGCVPEQVDATPFLEALGANPWCLLANPRAYEAVAALCAVIPEGVAKKLRTHVETSEEFDASNVTVGMLMNTSVANIASFLRNPDLLPTTIHPVTTFLLSKRAKMGAVELVLIIGTLKSNANAAREVAVEVESRHIASLSAVEIVDFLRGVADAGVADSIDVARLSQRILALQSTLTTETAVSLMCALGKMNIPHVLPCHQALTSLIWAEEATVTDFEPDVICDVVGVHSALGLEINMTKLTDVLELVASTVEVMTPGRKARWLLSLGPTKALPEDIALQLLQDVVAGLAECTLTEIASACVGAASFLGDVAQSMQPLMSSLNTALLSGFQQALMATTDSAVISDVMNLIVRLRGGQPDNTVFSAVTKMLREACPTLPFDMLVSIISTYAATTGRSAQPLLIQRCARNALVTLSTSSIPRLDDLIKLVNVMAMHTFVPDELFFDAVAQQVADVSETLNAVQVVAFLRAFAKVKVCDKDRLNTSLVMRATALADELSPSQMAEILRMLVELRVDAVPTLKRFVERTMDRLEDLSAKDAESFCAAMQAWGYKDGNLVTTMATVMSEQLHAGTELTSSSVTVVLSVISTHIAKLNQTDIHTVVLDLLEWVDTISAQFTVPQIVATLEAVARIKIKPSHHQALQPLLRRFVALIDSCSTTDLADICSALGRISTRFDSAMGSIADRMIEIGDKTVSGHDIARILQAFGKLKVTHKGLFSTMTKRLHVRAVINSLTPQDCILLLQAFGDVRHLDEVVLQTLSKVTLRHRAKLNHVDVVVAIVSMAKLRVHNEDFFGWMAELIIEHAEELSMNHVILVLQSYARMLMTHPEMAQILMQRVVDEIEDMDGKVCTSVLCALGQMDSHDIEKWNALGDRICVSFSDLTTRHIEDLCALCQRMNWRHEGLLLGCAEQLASLAEADAAAVSPAVARLLLDTLGIFLLHHAQARKVLSPIAAAASLEKDAVTI